jgi:hypothetical protein
VFAIAYERSHFLVSSEPTWHLLDRAIINEQHVSATRTIEVGDLKVPLFSLADLFGQFRTPAGTLAPAHYSLTVATPPGQPRAQQTLELDVR